MYGKLVVGSSTGCITCGSYHGGINMHMLGVDHPKDTTSGLKGGSLNGSPSSELLLGESLGYLPLGGW